MATFCIQHSAVVVAFYQFADLPKSQNGLPKNTYKQRFKQYLQACKA